MDFDIAHPIAMTPVHIGFPKVMEPVDATVNQGQPCKGGNITVGGFLESTFLGALLQVFEHTTSWNPGDRGTVSFSAWITYYYCQPLPSQSLDGGLRWFGFGLEAGKPPCTSKPPGNAHHP